MAAAIWSQKDMRSPSGGKARHRGGTQVGKAPPLPEMTISGLTESGLSGKIISPKIDIPRLCRTCGPPLRRAVSFLGFRFSKDSAQIALRHRAFGTGRQPLSIKMRDGTATAEALT